MPQTGPREQRHSGRLHWEPCLKTNRNSFLRRPFDVRLNQEANGSNLRPNPGPIQAGQSRLSIHLPRAHGSMCNGTGCSLRRQNLPGSSAPQGFRAPNDPKAWIYGKTCSKMIERMKTSHATPVFPTKYCFHAQARHPLEHLHTSFQTDRTDSETANWPKKPRTYSGIRQYGTIRRILREGSKRD